ncbi:HK97 gp10 family phage protein, partial [bacterium]|nr:HK97 gp10 family phage protein [bacterium]
VDMKAIEGVKTFLKRYPGELKDAVYEGVQEIALEIQRSAVTKLKEHGAIDLGQLWNSIHIHRISPTEVIVGTNVEYAAAVEFGTKGHWLTIDKIPGFRGWLRRHGIDLDAKMKYFYVHPKPKPYMEPAYQEGVRIAPNEIKKSVEAAMMQVGL